MLRTIIWFSWNCVCIVDASTLHKWSSCFTLTSEQVPFMLMSPFALEYIQIFKKFGIQYKARIFKRAAPHKSNIMALPSSYQVWPQIDFLTDIGICEVAQSMNSLSYKNKKATTLVQIWPLSFLKAVMLGDSQPERRMQNEWGGK